LHGKWPIKKLNINLKGSIPYSSQEWTWSKSNFQATVPGKRYEWCEALSH